MLGRLKEFQIKIKYNGTGLLEKTILIKKKEKVL